MNRQIPKVPPEMLPPLRALVRAADLFRCAFVQTAEGCPVDQTLTTLASPLGVAEDVIDRWLAHLRLTRPERQPRRCLATRKGDASKRTRGAATKPVALSVYWPAGGSPPGPRPSA
jgi:hypothetical protein